jgi:hypothetical protein
VKVSYGAAFLMAKVIKPQTVGEELMLPVAEEIGNIMLAEKACKGVNVVSQFNAEFGRWTRRLRNG